MIKYQNRHTKSMNCGCGKDDKCISPDCNCATTGVCTCGPACHCNAKKK